MSIYRMEIGAKLERSHSLSINQNHIPVLISSKMLREKSCGQVDLASFDPRNKRAFIYEVKKSGQVSSAQKWRLFKSCELIGAYLNSPVSLVVLD